MINTQPFFQGNLALVSQAVSELPCLLSEPGWNRFWEATQTIPETDLPGFLATHRAHLDESKKILSYRGDALSRFPAPLNTPVGFSAMSAFLEFAAWKKVRMIRDGLRQELRSQRKKISEEELKFLRKKLKLTEQDLLHPKVIESAAETFGRPDMKGGFSDSVAAYLKLAQARGGDPLFEFVFDQSFIWMVGQNSKREIDGLDPMRHGKWMVHIPDLDSAVELSIKLFSNFRPGEITCAKFFLTSNMLGGLYFMVYSYPDDILRASILESAAQRPSFFVSDLDCHELMSLAEALKSFYGKIRNSDYDGLKQKYLDMKERLGETGYGKEYGLSEIQRQVLHAALCLNPSSDQNNRFNNLAQRYFSGLNLCLLLSMFLNPQNANEMRRRLEADRSRKPAKLDF